MLRLRKIILSQSWPLSPKLAPMNPIVLSSNGPNSLSQMAASHRDLLTELLADKRNSNTRHAYEKDLRDFFRSMGRELEPESIAEFLSLDQFQAVALVLRYKSQLFDRELKESTVNRRLAAIKSLVKYARKVGRCSYSLEDIKGERVVKYRDTTGISREAYRVVLAGCERGTVAGKRDYALLRLLWDNALRRGEVAKASARDFDPSNRTLKILGKGKGTQVEVIDLSRPTTEALLDWLATRTPKADAPLFCSLDPVTPGHRLTGEAIRLIVVKYCSLAGVGKQMSPHRIRHSSITAALDATDGNVRKVQKLSRHANLQTLLVYDDNRQKLQMEITELLAEMV